MTENQKPTYIIHSANESGPLIRIGALWALRNSAGFSGQLDYIPTQPRIILMPFDPKNPPPTAARPASKAPVYKLFGQSNEKAPLVAVGAVWHTSDARGYQGVLNVSPRNGRLLMFENHHLPDAADDTNNIDWDDLTPF